MVWHSNHHVLCTLWMYPIGSLATTWMQNRFRMKKMKTLIQTHAQHIHTHTDADTHTLNAKHQYKIMLIMNLPLLHNCCNLSFSHTEVANTQKTKKMSQINFICISIENGSIPKKLTYFTHSKKWEIKYHIVDVI